MIDYTKEIKTNGGLKCRYLGTIRRPNPLHHGCVSRRVVVIDYGDYEGIVYLNDRGSDELGRQVIRNVPETHELVFNVYGDKETYSYTNRTDADRGARSDRTACVTLEWKDGDGL